MPLQLGDWRINSNGFEGYLFIASVDALGRVEGSMMLIGASHINGFWNEVTQELVFSPGPPPGEGDLLPIFYRGHLFSTPVTLRPGQDFNWNLAGYFHMLDTGDRQVPNAPTPSSRRSTFGWFAQCTAFV